MGTCTFITGPRHSGKLAYALGRARSLGPNVVLASLQAAEPEHLEQKVNLLRRRATLPSDVRFLDVEGDLASLNGLVPNASAVVVDNMGVWLTRRLHLEDEAISEVWKTELAALKAFPWPCFLLSQEMGWGFGSERPEERRYAALMGRLNRLTTTQVNEAWLVVAGCAMAMR